MSAVDRTYVGRSVTRRVIELDRFSVLLLERWVPRERADGSESPRDGEFTPEQLDQIGNAAQALVDAIVETGLRGYRFAAIGPRESVRHLRSRAA